MKKTIASILVIAVILFTACNNNDRSAKTDIPTDTSNTKKNDKAGNAAVTETNHTFTTVDATIAGSIKMIVDHYLHIKNALINDNGSEAANGGKAMTEVMGKIDKSLLTSEQKKVYDDVEEDLKEHAEHISSNASKIEHQREHFSMMSEDVYDLVKAFGGGRDLYHDHCPMANDNKGAMWLSETKTIKNPYFAGEMNECVKVMEVIK